MSLKVEGKICPICGGYLFDDDEIVWCPECGAPHHKDCYKTIGKCGFFEIHGTEELEEKLKESTTKEKVEEETTQEQTPVMKIRCNSCGAAFPMNYDRCPNCSAENKAKNGNFFMFDMLGGVAKGEDIGEGVTADKAAKFVAVSPHKFLPKFKAFKNGKKSFFSLWTLFFPAANFASRKMYSTAFLCGIIEVAGTLLMMPLASEMNKLGLHEYYEMYSFLMENAFTNGNVRTLLILSLIGMFVLLFYGIISAFIFDKIYYKHVLAKVKQIETENTNTEDIEHAFRKHGGLNIFSFVITIMLLQYIPQIIAAFIL